MSKVKMYYTLAVSMFILSLVEGVSGFVLWLILPSGNGGGGGGRGRSLVEEASFWGLTRHTWIDIHDWVAVALLVIVVIHIILHWKWIARMTVSLFRGMKKKPAATATTA